MCTKRKCGNDIRIRSDVIILDMILHWTSTVFWMTRWMTFHKLQLTNRQRNQLTAIFHDNVNHQIDIRRRKRLKGEGVCDLSSHSWNFPSECVFSLSVLQFSLVGYFHPGFVLFLPFRVTTHTYVYTRTYIYVGSFSVCLLSFFSSHSLLFHSCSLLLSPWFSLQFIINKLEIPDPLQHLQERKKCYVR